MQHRDKTILAKIADEISVAMSMTENVSSDIFENNEMIKRAVCMTVINVGELVKNLSDELRREYSFVPWKSIAGFRDIAAHKYQTLKMKDVYLTVINDFPVLKENINKILKQS